MKRNKRKDDHCLNCGTSFVDKKVNYCPNCGQENTDNYVSTKTLLGDFFNNYLSLDSRFIRTLSPFLFKPGEITQAFLEGKRLQYAHPIRWYLVISLIHFLVFNYYQESDGRSSQNDKIINFDSEGLMTDTQIDSLLSVDESLKYDSSNNLFTEDYMYSVLEQMALSEEFSSDEIYDSLKIDNRDFGERVVATILIKSLNSSAGELNSYILDKIPIIIFFILPIYALFLKLFFYKKGYYIKHLIHSLHIHSFLFFILTIGWSLGLLFNIEADHIAIVSFSLAFLYILFSFKKLYQQGYFALISKEFSIGFFYTISALVVFLVGIIISMIMM